MSAAYMLDTDVLSYALRGEGRVLEHISNHGRSELCISSISLAELRFGVVRRASTRLDRIVRALAEQIQVLSFDVRCAYQYGVVAAKLEAEGRRIGKFDMLIAAHAISLDATLVTNNVAHFERIRGLRVENWT
jgi:tRNA(fMet)-specific endonuclease VapC